MPETVGDVSLAMLDKAQTYELARAAGITCPETWNVATEEDARALVDAVPFPCALKPLYSHLWARHFTVKVLVAHDREELVAHLARVVGLGLEVLVTEIVPGPDDLVWDYRTYVDAAGEPQFEMTTRRLRCYPVHFGNNCYLATWRNDEVAEEGRRFVQGIGLRGLADVEFKRDPRDGRLKLIECNHRFFGAQELLRRAGIDIGRGTYLHAAGEGWPVMQHERDVRLWFVAKDLRAAKQLRAEGELTWPSWVRSLARRDVYTPVLALDDLGPTLRNARTKLGRRLPIGG
jgi:predicted ATP-grasp superfamily ATP-dependent carboligase